MTFTSTTRKRFLTRRRFLSLIFICALAASAATLPRVGAQNPRTTARPSATPATTATTAPTATAATATARGVNLSAEERAALESISAASLRGHLSFIASDALEGRDTPSRGLDMAAEYIAAQFRRAGLEAVGDDGYFQTANWTWVERTMEGFELSFSGAGQETNIRPADVSLSLNLGNTSIWGIDAPVSLTRAPVFKIDYRDANALGALSAEQIAGRVVLVEMPDPRRETGAKRFELLTAENEFLTRLAALRAALVIALDRDQQRPTGAGRPRLIDPEARDAGARRRPGMPVPASVPFIILHNTESNAALRNLKSGETNLTATARIAAPAQRPQRLRNVAGLLRGSDPALRDTYLLVSAHYDHIGIRTEGEGDRIFNGANDDGSGTVSVIEIASALARLKVRPRRSILFMTYFGEERGGLGSRFYAEHPLFPLAKTIVNVNLEQLGRTDDTEGARVAQANLTGFDYSDLGNILQAAGSQTGVRVWKHEANSDRYFGASDNQSLADVGVPAHTVSVAYAFPDYHGAGDHWDKIDYDNMAKVDRMLATAILMMAASADVPRWNEQNPKAEKYVRAWRELHAAK